ncbi:MAG: hypothetical protein H7Z11_18465 [Verrucomicrobia bacterium]|nr:hypothetical protein [Leptolyngbya sp. ES-bin-22]
MWGLIDWGKSQRRSRLARITSPLRSLKNGWSGLRSITHHHVAPWDDREAFYLLE